MHRLISFENNAKQSAANAENNAAKKVMSTMSLLKEELEKLICPMIRRILQSYDLDTSGPDFSFSTATSYVPMEAYNTPVLTFNNFLNLQILSKRNA